VMAPAVRCASFVGRSMPSGRVRVPVPVDLPSVEQGVTALPLARIIDKDDVRLERQDWKGM
jgi:hypothetical protein